MAEVKLRSIRKRYGEAAEVIHGVHLDIGRGEFMVFVGPSGCGKSTLLRMIAGLEEISAGDIYIGEQRVNDVAPARRDVAMVFQSYALYPHMNVYDNLSFGLKLAGVSKRDIDKAVRRAADILRIGDLLGRKPRELSGGQRQRVAIGRAIVRQPKVFLFDEPLSNLDAGLRVQMRVELSRLHHELKTTMIYVTHDQVEAMTLGERIAVFNGGTVEQVGSPLDLYERPANLFVAGFLGSPRMNLMSAELERADGRGAGMRLSCGESVQVAIAAPANGNSKTVTLGIRPEHVVIARPHRKNGNADDCAIAGRIALVEHLGDALLAYVSIANARDYVVAKLSAHGAAPAVGETVQLSLATRHCHVFDNTGRALARLN